MPNNNKRLDLLGQLVTQQETKLDELQTTLADMLCVLKNISNSFGNIVCPEDLSDDLSSEDVQLEDINQTLVRRMANESGDEQHEGREDEQQGKGRENRNRKRRSKVKRKGIDNGKGKGKENLKGMGPEKTSVKSEQRSCQGL